MPTPDPDDDPITRPRGAPLIQRPDHLEPGGYAEPTLHPAQHQPPAAPSPPPPPPGKLAQVEAAPAGVRLVVPHPPLPPAGASPEETDAVRGAN